MWVFVYQLLRGDRAWLLYCIHWSTPGVWLVDLIVIQVCDNSHTQEHLASKEGPDLVRVD